jgi:hypothetical protein
MIRHAVGRGLQEGKQFRVAFAASREIVAGV